MAGKGLGLFAVFAGLAAAILSGGASLLLGPTWTSAALGVGSLTLGSTATYLWGASLLAGYMSNSIAAREARSAANASLQDRSQTIRSTDEPVAMVYGRARVGGVLAFASKPFGAKSEKVILVYDLVGHPCDGVEQLWLNGEPVNVDPSTGYVTSGKWAAKVSEMRAVAVDAPAVWNPATPTSNRITAPSAATGVLTVVRSIPGTESYGYTQGVDYDLYPNTFDIINLAIPPGEQLTVTYKGTFPLEGYVKVKFWLGDETGDFRRDYALEAATYNSGSGLSDWDATCTADGICRVSIEMSYNETTFADGTPQASAVVRGWRVLDTRTSNTAWSDNAALCTYHYLTHSWGVGVDTSRVPTALVNEAADKCDVLIPGDEFDTPAKRVKQFTVNGFLSTSQSPLDNLDELCAAMGGSCAPSGNEWRMFAGAWPVAGVPADAVLTDDNLIGDIECTSFLTAGETFNCIKGRYRDETTWQTTDMPVYKSATYIAEDDGLEVWKDFDLPLTINPYRAQRMGKLHLHRARNALMFGGTFDLAAWRYQAGDRLRLQLSEAGWDTVVQDGGTGKVFKVVRRRWLFPDQVKLQLIEDTASIYSWTHTEQYGVDPTPNSGLASASDVQEPTNLEGSASATDFFIAPDGTNVGFVKLTWDAITDSSVLGGGWLELQWKRSHETAFRTQRISPFETQYRLEGIRQDEVLHVQLIAWNASQARSDATPIEPTAGLNPGMFSVQTAFFESGSSVWSGNLLTNTDFKYGTSGWALFNFASPSYALSLKAAAMPPQLRLQGPPAWNVVIEEEGAGTVAPSAILCGFSQVKAASCNPGDHWAFSVSLEQDGCDAGVGIAFYRGDDSFIPGSLSLLPAIQKTYVNAAFSSAYTRHTVTSIAAPADARGVRGLVYKYGTRAPASTSRVWAVEPDLRKYDGSISSAPPFALGAPGPRTFEILQPYDSVGTSMTTTNQVFLDHILGTIVAEAAGTVTVTVVYEIVAKAAAGYTNNLDVGIYQNNKRALVSRREYSVSGATDVPKSGTIVASFSCVARESISPLLRLTRSHYGVGANYNATDKIHKVECSFKVEYN